ncbi:MAG TPA: hypothetical protein VFI84_01835 [Candidatus Saccharimonadales bacterium]|nr:hypothetical protein [Candidatus Saccharimonadales bacterium]
MSAATFHEAGGFSFLDRVFSEGNYAGKHRHETQGKVIPMQLNQGIAIAPETIVAEERMEIAETILEVVRDAVARGENPYGDKNSLYSEAGWWYFDRKVLTKFYAYQEKYKETTGCLREYLFAVPETEEDIRRRVATMDLIDSGIIFEEKPLVVEQEQPITEQEMEIPEYEHTAVTYAATVTQEEKSVPQSEYRVVLAASSDAFPTPTHIPGAKEVLITPQIKGFIAKNQDAIMAKWIEVVPLEVQASYAGLPDVEQAYLDIRRHKLPEVREHVDEIMQRSGVPTRKSRKERNSIEHRLAMATVKNLRNKHSGGAAGFAQA